MRLGLVLHEGREAQMAKVAEAHGLFGVLAGVGDPMTAITAAVYASTATEHVRIVARVQLGLDHPVTIAEELSILDNVNNGRTVVLADTGELDHEQATDELAVLREALGNRPVSHEGPHWRVPAGIPANATAPKAISVTPKPAQLEVPFWVTGTLAFEVGEASGLPVLAREAGSIKAGFFVQPAMGSISGQLEQDRVTVAAWDAAGATHLLLELPAEPDLEAILTLVSRHLAPAVLMPHFPRVMSDSRVPLPWPGDQKGGG